MDASGCSQHEGVSARLKEGNPDADRMRAGDAERMKERSCEGVGVKVGVWMGMEVSRIELLHSKEFSWMWKCQLRFQAYQ
jgi:hypothetical protein